MERIFNPSKIMESKLLCLRSATNNARFYPFHCNFMAFMFIALHTYTQLKYNYSLFGNHLETIHGILYLLSEVKMCSITQQLVAERISFLLEFGTTKFSFQSQNDRITPTQTYHFSLWKTSIISTNSEFTYISNNVHLEIPTQLTSYKLCNLLVSLFPYL